jgi:hypothetical protein
MLLRCRPEPQARGLLKMAIIRGVYHNKREASRTIAGGGTPRISLALIAVPFASHLDGRDRDMGCGPSAVVEGLLCRFALACCRGGPDGRDIRAISCWIGDGTTPKHSRTCDQHIRARGGNQRGRFRIDATVNFKMDGAIRNQRPQGRDLVDL